MGYKMKGILGERFARGVGFLGSDYPIMCGAMSWISNHLLVAAISNAGGFGVIACGAMTPDLLDAEVKATFARTDRTFGVNIVTLHPQCEELVDVCISNKVSHIILGGGLPKVSLIQKIASAGVRSMCFAPTLSMAQRLIKAGVGAIIVEGSEAGGHIGPVSTSVLAQEILPNINEVPVFMAGGIGRGEMIASYMLQGASGCQLGTRFVCAKESTAHPRFKKCFIDSPSRDAVVSVQLDEDLPVIPVRAIKNQASNDFMSLQREVVGLYKRGDLERSEAQLKIEEFWVGALRRAAIEGDIEYGSVMAGQSVGVITSEQTAQEIIDELLEQISSFQSVAVSCA